MSSLEPEHHSTEMLPIPAAVAIGRPEHDRLGRFVPALLAMTLAAAALEMAAAIAFAERILATAALSTAFFALGVAFAGYQMRRHRPLHARVALGITLTVFAGIGAYLVPDVAPSMALLPVLAVVLVVRYVDRNRLIVVAGAAVGSTVLILAIDAAGGARPLMPAPIGTLFHATIIVAVVILVLAGLADFAMEARQSLADLRSSTERNLRVTTARLSIVSSFRVLHAQATPEATAESIAKALGDLPLVDVAAILEVSSSGEASVLAIACHADAPVEVGEKLPAARAAYLLDRSRQGAWAEPWAERPTPTLNDERLAALGLKAQAYAPILFGDDIVGLVIIATRDPDQAAHLLADLPSVSEAAAVAGSILAPALMARRQTGAARVRIAEIIAARAFHPVFQPVIDLHTGLTVGFEALTRFASGDPPDRVFSDAAKAGIGSELEAATLRAAVRFSALLPPDAWLSLNVSPSFLGAYAQLAEILADRNRPIILEVTEHEVIDDYSRLHAAMRALGSDVRLAVDDAGAGVANFPHLVDLRPDLIKIDAGMIRGVEADVSRQALIVGLVHFAEVTGAQVLAEGLETQPERETVERLGVTLGQGFLLARPAPVGRWIEAPLPVTPRPRRSPRAVTAVLLPN
ncbi:MAG: EAL domain-containing protein [Chloroflexota bacterium]|nr:EAL domain-containing protein [Chloroflexota bacterium]